MQFCQSLLFAKVYDKWRAGGLTGAGKSTVAQILAKLSETAEIVNFADAQ
jgi:hypothetical protein